MFLGKDLSASNFLSNYKSVVNQQLFILGGKVSAIVYAKAIALFTKNSHQQNLQRVFPDFS